MLGVKDALSTQIRKASFNVGKGTMTAKKAIDNYGQIKQLNFKHKRATSSWLFYQEFLLIKCLKQLYFFEY